MSSSIVKAAPPSSAPSEEKYLRQKWIQAFQRVNAYHARHSIVVGFFADNNDVRSLPCRLERLCILLKKEDEHRRAQLTAAIFSAAPPSFLKSFQTLFTSILQQRQARWEGKDDKCCLLSSEEEEQKLFYSLRTLHWLPHKLHRSLTESIHLVVYDYIYKRISGQYEDDAIFSSLTAWKEEVLFPFVVQSVDSLEYKTRIEKQMAHVYCQIRIQELFSIVTEFPESLPAVLELKYVGGNNLQLELGRELKTSLERRLLHPGAQTEQIIDVYVNTIKVLRELDPSDGLLDAVAEPVRSYLRGRSDTIRCIITSLTDEKSGGDLYHELRRLDARPLEQAQYDSDDDEDEPDFDWQPAPSIYKQQQQQTSSRSNSSSGDLLSMLVGIYGSKDLFVDEYRIMLADKLLANLDFDTDAEVHNLELLKLRFGEMSMRQCEIMIKDIDDSKRIIANIHSTIKNKTAAKTRQLARSANEVEPVSPFDVDAAIVSHIFWPALQKDAMKNHPRIQAQIDKFSMEYAKLKNPRRLIWFNQLGTVQLQLEVLEQNDDGMHTQMKDFTCTPLQATLISHFEDQSQWKAKDLSEEVGVSEDAVRKKIGFWINHRVIQIVRTAGVGEIVYELASVHDLALNDNDFDFDQEDDDGEGQAVSLGATEAKEMKTYESYVFGMLSNLKEMSLSKIHNNLKMFVTGSEHKYNKTIQQLSVFLQQLCKDEKLECGADGMYKLVRK